MEKMLSIRQLARRWGVHHNTVRRWTQEIPEFPKAIRIGWGYRWRETEIQLFEKKKIYYSNLSLPTRD